MYIYIYIIHTLIHIHTLIYIYIYIYICICTIERPGSLGRRRPRISESRDRVGSVTRAVKIHGNPTNEQQICEQIKIHENPAEENVVRQIGRPCQIGRTPDVKIRESPSKSPAHPQDRKDDVYIYIYIYIERDR